MYKTPLSIELETFKAYKLQRFGFSWFNPKLIWTSLKAVHTALTDASLAIHQPAFPNPEHRWIHRIHPKTTAWLLAAQMTRRLAKEKSSYMILNHGTKAVEGYITLRPDYIRDQQSFAVPCLGFACFSQKFRPDSFFGRKALLTDGVRTLLRHAFKNKTVAQIKSYVHLDDALSTSVLHALNFERTGTPPSTPHVQGRTPRHFARYALYEKTAQNMGLKVTIQ